MTVITKIERIPEGWLVEDNGGIVTFHPPGMEGGDRRSVVLRRMWKRLWDTSSWPCKVRVERHAERHGMRRSYRRFVWPSVSMPMAFGIVVAALANHAGTPVRGLATALWWHHENNRAETLRAVHTIGLQLWDDSMIRYAREVYEEYRAAGRRGQKDAEIAASRPDDAPATAVEVARLASLVTEAIDALIEARRFPDAKRLRGALDATLRHPAPTKAHIRTIARAARVAVQRALIEA